VHTRVLNSVNLLDVAVESDGSNPHFTAGAAMRAAASLYVEWPGFPL